MGDLTKVMKAREGILDAVLDAYGRIGRDGSRSPAGMNFPTGAALAENLGYPRRVLDLAATGSVSSFVGAAPLPRYVLADRVTPVVADLGCGAGLDSLWLGSAGARVYSLEVSPEMISNLAASLEGEALNITPVLAFMPELPLRTGSFTHAIMNGVANIIPDKISLMEELCRILVSGGQVLIADVLTIGEVDDSIRDEPEAWVWCVGGALSPGEWRELSRRAGFAKCEVSIEERFEPLARGIIRLIK